MVFQSYTLLPWLTARGNVELALEAVGKSKQECRSIADEHLDLVRLTRLADAFPSELSGGMKQRVAIARALSYRPEDAVDGRALRRPLSRHPTRHDPASGRDGDIGSGTRQSLRDRQPDAAAGPGHQRHAPTETGRASFLLVGQEPRPRHAIRTPTGARSFRRGLPRRSRSRCGDRHSVRVRLVPSPRRCRAGPRRRGGWACRRRRRRAARRPPRPAPRVPVGRHQTV